MDNKVEYDRGSALSIFSSDRMEDIVELAASLLIAMLVYFLV